MPNLAHAHSGTVLVVEDEPPIRLLLQDGLSGEGYVVRAARDGAEALKILEEDGVDVILLDLMLPGMNGLQLAGEVRRRWPIAIIAMSASTQMLNEADKNPDIDKTVSKPFEWNALIDDLQRAVAA